MSGEGLQRLSEATRLRVAAEQRAGAAWHDIVLRELERRSLETLAQEEQRVLSAARDFDDAVRRAVQRTQTP